MKIHNYGNDYVQAQKFKKESVKNVCNQATENRPEPSGEVSAEATEHTEEAKEEKPKTRKKK